MPILLAFLVGWTMARTCLDVGRREQRPKETECDERDEEHGREQSEEPGHLPHPALLDELHEGLPAGFYIVVRDGRRYEGVLGEAGTARHTRLERRSAPDPGPSGCHLDLVTEQLNEPRFHVDRRLELQRRPSRSQPTHTTSMGT